MSEHVFLSLDDFDADDSIHYEHVISIQKALIFSTYFSAAPKLESFTSAHRLFAVGQTDTDRWLPL